LVNCLLAALSAYLNTTDLGLLNKYFSKEQGAWLLRCANPEHAPYTWDFSGERYRGAAVVVVCVAVCGGGDGDVDGGGGAVMEAWWWCEALRKCVCVAGGGALATAGHPAPQPTHRSLRHATRAPTSRACRHLHVPHPGHPASLLQEQ
jgi:hypothetical protein